eukprot:Lithocolla_globosa_v1_NODE_1601_length_2456_cov_16.386089.p2 type:complete len:112 gc:universal NODE_1601_length_2456_cov_16.386089:459-124(-)
MFAVQSILRPPNILSKRYWSQAYYATRYVLVDGVGWVGDCFDHPVCHTCGAGHWHRCGGTGGRGPPRLPLPPPNRWLFVPRSGRSHQSHPFLGPVEWQTIMEQLGRRTLWC